MATIVYFPKEKYEEFKELFPEFKECCFYDKKKGMYACVAECLMPDYEVIGD